MCLVSRAFSETLRKCVRGGNISEITMSEERCGTRDKRASEVKSMIKTGEKISGNRMLSAYSPLVTARSGLASNIIHCLITVVSSRICRHRYRIYSSSPKNTLTGNQASPHTLNRSLRLSSFCISSVDRSQPSNSKFFSILA